MIDPIPTTCAVCQLSDGLVANVIIASPSDLAQDGCQLIEIMTGQACGIGWSWDGINFIKPLAYAVCQISDGLVIDITTDLFYILLNDCQLIEIADDQICKIGWYWDGINFLAPLDEAPA